MVKYKSCKNSYLYKRKKKFLTIFFIFFNLNIGLTLIHKYYIEM